MSNQNQSILNAKKNGERHCETFSKEKAIDIQGHEIVHLRVSEIDLVDTIHLETPTLDLNGELQRVQAGYISERPIIVRTLENGRYGLVSGLKRYCIAKIMDIEFIPGIVYIDKI